MITAKKNHEITNRNIEDSVKRFAEGDLQEKIAEAVANHKFDVKVSLPMHVDADALTSYVADYGYEVVKCGYDVVIKW